MRPPIVGANWFCKQVTYSSYRVFPQTIDHLFHHWQARIHRQKYCALLIIEPDQLLLVCPTQKLFDSGYQPFFMQKKSRKQMSFSPNTNIYNTIPKLSPDEQTCYPLDTVVWATVDGFPPWPARVVSRSQISEHQRHLVKKKIRKNEALVMFFNDNNRFCVTEESKLELFYQDTVDEAIKRNKSSKKYMPLLQGAAQSAEEFIDINKPNLNLIPIDKRRKKELPAPSTAGPGRPRGKSPKLGALKRSNSRASIDRKAGPGKKKRKSISSMSPDNDDGKTAKKEGQSAKAIRRPKGSSAPKPPKTSTDSIRVPSKKISQKQNTSSKTGKKRVRSSLSNLSPSSEENDADDDMRLKRGDGLGPADKIEGDMDEGDNLPEEISTKREPDDGFESPQANGPRGVRATSASNRHRGREREDGRLASGRENEPSTTHNNERHASLSENEESPSPPSHFPTDSRRGRGKRKGRGRGGQHSSSPKRRGGSVHQLKKSDGGDEVNGRRSKPIRGIPTTTTDGNGNDGDETDTSSGGTERNINAQLPPVMNNGEGYRPTTRTLHGEEVDLSDVEGNQDTQQHPQADSHDREEQTQSEDDGEDTIDDDDDDDHAYGNRGTVGIVTDQQDVIDDQRDDQVLKDVSRIGIDANHRGEQYGNLDDNKERKTSSLIKTRDEDVSEARGDKVSRWDNGDGEVLYDGYDCVPEEELIKPYDQLSKDALISLLERREKEIGRLQVLVWRQSALLRKNTVLGDVNDVFDHCESTFQAVKTFESLFDWHNDNCSNALGEQRQSKSNRVGDEGPDAAVETEVRIQDCDKCGVDFKMREDMLCSAAHKLSEIYFSAQVNMTPVIEQVSDIVERLKPKSSRAALALRNVAGLWLEVCSCYRADDEDDSFEKELLRDREARVQMDSSASDGVDGGDRNGRRASARKRKRSLERGRDHERDTSPYKDNNNQQRGRDTNRNELHYNRDEERQHGRDYEGFGRYDSSLRTPSPSKSSEGEDPHERELGNEHEGRAETGEHGNNDVNKKDEHNDREEGDVMEESNDKALQSVMAEEEAKEHESKSDKMDLEDEENVSNTSDMSDKEDGKSSTDAVKLRRGFQNEHSERQGNTDKHLVHDDDYISADERIGERDERSREKSDDREKRLRINGSGRRAGNGRGRRGSDGGTRRDADSSSGSRSEIRSRSRDRSRSRGRRRSRERSRSGGRGRDRERNDGSRGSESDRGGDRRTSRDWRGGRRRRSHSRSSSRSSDRSPDAERREGTHAVRHGGLSEPRGRDRRTDANNRVDEKHGSANGREESSTHHRRRDHMDGEARHRIEKENRYASNDRSNHVSNYNEVHSRRASNGDGHKSENVPKHHRSSVNGPVQGPAEKKRGRGDGSEGEKLSKERREVAKRLKEGLNLIREDKSVKHARKEITSTLEAACWKYSASNRKKYQQVNLSLHRLIQSYARNRNSGHQTPSYKTIADTLQDIAHNEKTRFDHAMSLVEFCMDKEEGPR